VPLGGKRPREKVDDLPATHAAGTVQHERHVTRSLRSGEANGRHERQRERSFTGNLSIRSTDQHGRNSLTTDLPPQDEVAVEPFPGVQDDSTCAAFVGGFQYRVQTATEVGRGWLCVDIHREGQSHRVRVTGQQNGGSDS